MLLNPVTHSDDKYGSAANIAHVAFKTDYYDKPYSFIFL